MLGVWGKMSYNHLDRLELEVFWGHRAHFVGHLIAFYWNILPLDV